MSDRIPSASIARAAVNTIKEAKEAGEELGRMISEMQADTERSVRQYQHRVLEQRRRARRHDYDLDQRALDEWLAQEQRSQSMDQLRQEIERTYGTGSWQKIQDTKRRMQEIEAQDMREANRLRHQMNDLFWWCLGLAALIVYSFKLYK